MRAEAAVVAVVLAAAVAAGAVEFPRALEPERADAEGIVLLAHVDSSPGGAPVDWYSAQPSAPAKERDGFIRLAAPATGRMLISRLLPVFPHTCYAITATLDVTNGTTAVVVYDAEVRRFLDYRLVDAKHAPDVRFRFNSSHDRRITLAIAGRIGARARLGTVSLTRLPEVVDCGRDRAGTDIGQPLRRRP